MLLFIYFKHIFHIQNNPDLVVSCLARAIMENFKVNVFQNATHWPPKWTQQFYTLHAYKGFLFVIQMSMN